MMQSCHSVFDEVTLANLDVVFGKVEDGQVDAVVATICSRDKSAAIALAQQILAEGWALDILMAQIAEKVMADNSISDIKKAAIVKTLSDTESQFTDGGSEELNLTSCFATLSTIGI